MTYIPLVILCVVILACVVNTARIVHRMWRDRNASH